MELKSLFPLDPSDKPQGPKKPFFGDNRGIAMILSMMVISMMLIFMADMLVSSAVAVRLATAHRDNIKAEYLAKSGKNLALFLLLADLGIDLAMFEQNASVKPSDSAGDIWGLMNGLPIGDNPADPNAITQSLLLSKVNDSKIIETLKSFDGVFSINIADETGKVNVNYCANDKTSLNGCRTLLEALMSCPAEKEFLERKKLEPKTIANNIKDWVDSATTPEDKSQGTESELYDSREPDIGPKNAPFDSLEELKHVAGWDDEMHAVFSPYITIFPVLDPTRKFDNRDTVKVNLNSAALSMMTCVVHDKGEDCRRQAILARNPPGRARRPRDVSSAGDMNKLLKETFCMDDKKAQFFTYRSDIYRIEVTGEVGDQKRTLKFVIQRGSPTPEDKKKQFVGSYKFLEWKML